ncbi:amino acid permease [Acinetobacter portensis]|uniref:Amino acid permease n=4 Tax=Acinetobacter TaxID=469 RepID=A0A6L6GHP3_9GAMM|nr:MULTISPECIES: amino acid permease [Acinetobacter]MCK7609568.1 amino acid permease [Acinetobacter portensis]MCK7640344.1 amino acid permease [Acinetobacter portensis]MDY6458823.1 amino acid permease [Acinetobacter faecalis]MDY6462758.1 amino acid permease [Acinetobacter faecalis]MDY6483972.1 amino acid permease [Acinetobacter faecalis]
MTEQKINSPAVGDGDLKRSLSNRHLQLIAIGGAIGTGLFMGSGKTISLAGPSILFIYMIIGFMVFLVMRALGELLLSNFNYKSFIDFSTDLIGPWAGYFVGWTYWLCWITIGIADLSAIIYYLQFFNGGVSFSPLEGVLISVASILFITCLNLATVKLFGEMEFWFAMVKIVAIIVLIAVGGWMIFTGFTSTAGEVASFGHLWSHGGMFPTGFTGFLAGFQIAIFAFVGVELVGTTAAETKDPEKNLPKAVNSIPIRIIIFYVLALVIVMSVTPWNKIDPSISPFVNLFSQAGIAAAAIIMNFVVLSSVMSSMNSGVFSTSRMLFGLSRENQAPDALGKLNKRAVPANALYFSTVCLLLGAALQYFVPNTVLAFTLATTLSTILFICVWLMIIWSYVVYYRTRPELHAKSTFKLPGGLFTCAVVVVFFIGTIGILALEEDTRKALMVSPIWFIILIIGYFGFYKPRNK